jgi:hypothetical protein
MSTTAGVSEPARTSPDKPPWASWPEERLLALRFSELDLTIDGTPLEPRIQELYSELAAHGIDFRPHFWLSDEWFTPDDVPGVAIPFYLAHPRLARLEEAQMLEVEGGTPEWCLRILRHEAGHAIDNAYALRRRRRRQRLFGRSSTPYPEYYLPKPHSRRFVVHFERWYAQSHPDEDFAETFAVWLTPDSQWRERYAGWPVLKKLEYMDALMRSIAGQPPVIRTRRTVDPLRRLTRTLGEHYKKKREHYGLDYPNYYDRDLRRLFSDKPEFRKNMTAARFIGRIRRDVRRTVAHWSGEYQYIVEQVLEDIIERCRELRLRLAGPEDRARGDFTVLLTVHVMNYLHSGQHRIAL